MKQVFGENVLELKRGDIVLESTDAIVNAANSSLLGGGGVDGAIHRAGGPRILEECKRLGGCETGDAKITSGGNLPAKFVIHTVGPIYGQEEKNEPALLASCYRRSLEIAAAKGVKSIAFPSISTGAYGYPVHEASEIALRTVGHFLEERVDIVYAVFVLFDERTYEAYAKTMKKIWG